MDDGLRVFRGCIAGFIICSPVWGLVLWFMLGSPGCSAGNG